MTRKGMKINDLSGQLQSNLVTFTLISSKTCLFISFSCNCFDFGERKKGSNRFNFIACGGVRSLAGVLTGFRFINLQPLA